MGWNNITLRQLKALEQLEGEGLSDDELLIERLNIIFDEDCSNLSIPKFLERANECAFMTEPIPEVKLKNKYIINGREYQLLTNPFELSMGQFIDFKNTNVTESEKLLAIIFTPTGHEYNDGYDMQQVVDDMLSLPAPDVSAITRFFFRVLERYKQIIRFCLRRELRKMMKKNFSREDREAITNLMDYCYTLLRS